MMAQRDTDCETEEEQLRAHIRRLERLLIQCHDVASEAEIKIAHQQDALEQWISDMETENLRLRTENDALRTEIGALLVSTSWRVTAPLRWLRTRVK